MTKTSRVLFVAVLVAAVGLLSQDRPPGFQDYLRRGDVAALAEALDKDPALVSQRDAQGVQPLFWAAVYGQQAIVELLLARGADPRSSSPLGTVLYGSAAGGHTEIIRLLVAKGARSKRSIASMRRRSMWEDLISDLASARSTV